MTPQISCETCKHFHGYVIGNETKMELLRKSCCGGMDFPYQGIKLASCLHYEKNDKMTTPLKTNWREIEKARKKESEAEDCMLPMRDRC